MEFDYSQLKQEDITKIFIEMLRNPRYGMYSQYGYDIYLPNLIRVYFSISNGTTNEADAMSYLMPLFYSVAWEFCRRGIIRPGISRYNGQSTEDGNAGNGYSITPFGRQWLNESSQNDFIPTEPERFAQMLEPYKDKFGFGFHQKAQEAIRCYGAHAYLACCAMSGAAAESILLATAISKIEDESIILQQYRSAHGRSKIENELIGKANKNLQNEFKSFSSLLNYWRDEAAHGSKSRIEENEAFTAIAMLLRFAMFIDAKWDELISK
ncbi:hypothetical protein [Legionella cincinnatiensis]|uniref:DUF4145 domain-containing protein n=1 Tax=Legionella cincinnatiensis TaxID=28085 RepID=A0A378ITX9_9GAMM|nr:hypothetical protein [Legionella cincinnatiensis]KTC83389.1 hypothetical protein Lcin_2076 [Legionella cincinnatiensis]STX35474.1 Uncharacterised protein [Legionella cincinnatiensis]